jgi:hypothetical protein
MKLRITENQLNTIKKTLNEGVDNQYSREVKISYYYHGVSLKGAEIADIMDNSVTLSFNIELEGRSWGIKDISLNGIKGPSEIDLEIQYYDEREELLDANVTIPLDWDRATINKQSGHGVITVGDDIEITLVNDQNGGIVVKSIEIPVYSA